MFDEEPQGPARGQAQDLRSATSPRPSRRTSRAPRDEVGPRSPTPGQPVPSPTRGTRLAPRSPTPRTRSRRSPRPATRQRRTSRRPRRCQRRVPRRAAGRRPTPRTRPPRSPRRPSAAARWPPPPRASRREEGRQEEAVPPRSSRSGAGCLRVQEARRPASSRPTGSRPTPRRPPRPRRRPRRPVGPMAGSHARHRGRQRAERRRPAGANPGERSPTPPRSRTGDHAGQPRRGRRRRRRGRSPRRPAEPRQHVTRPSRSGCGRRLAGWRLRPPLRAAGRPGGARRPSRRSAPTTSNSQSMRSSRPAGISSRGTRHQPMMIACPSAARATRRATVSRWSRPVCATSTTSASGAASRAASTPPGRGASTFVISLGAVGHRLQPEPAQPVDRALAALAG